MRRRTVLPGSVAWVKTRKAGIHTIERHLSNRGPLSGRWLSSCCWRSSTTPIEFVGGFIYRQPDLHTRVKIQ